MCFDVCPDAFTQGNGKLQLVVIFVIGGLYFILAWAFSPFIFNGEFLTNHWLLRFMDESFIYYSFYFVLAEWLD